MAELYSSDKGLISLRLNHLQDLKFSLNLTEFVFYLLLCSNFLPSCLCSCSLPFSFSHGMVSYSIFLWNYVVLWRLLSID